MLLSGFDPGKRFRARNRRRKRCPLRDVERDTAERVDEIRETLHVDEHKVLDRDPENTLDGVPHRLNAGARPMFRGVRVQVRMLLTVGVQVVDEAVIPAVVAVRKWAVQRRPGRETHLLQVARDTHEHGGSGLGIDTGQGQTVRPQPLAVGPRIPAQQQNVVAAVHRRSVFAAVENCGDGGTRRPGHHRTVAGQPCRENKTGDRDPGHEPPCNRPDPDQPHEPQRVQGEHHPQHRIDHERDLRHAEHQRVGGDRIHGHRPDQVQQQQHQRQPPQHERGDNPELTQSTVSGQKLRGTRNQQVECHEPPGAPAHRLGRGGVGHSDGTGGAHSVDLSATFFAATESSRLFAKSSRLADSFGSDAASIRIARSPAFRAPPMETVATGTPAGI